MRGWRRRSFFELGRTHAAKTLFWPMMRDRGWLATVERSPRCCAIRSVCLGRRCANGTQGGKDKLSMSSTTCRATKKNGAPCQAYAGTGSEYCFSHDPALAVKRAAARSAGGKARHGRKVGTTGQAGPVEVENVADVCTLLCATINDVLLLENSLQRSRTIGYLAGIIIRAFEIGEMQQQLEAIHRILTERGT